MSGVSLGQLFCVFVHLPDSKRIALRVLADGEITHLRDGRFRHANFAAEFLDLRREASYRIHADVVGNRLLWMLAFFERPIGSLLGSGGVDVPIILRACE